MFRQLEREKRAVENSEKQLNNTNAKQEALIKNISDVIGIVDQKGINRYKSSNVEKWFGWKPQELIGKDTWANVHADDLEQVQAAFGTILQNDLAVVTAEYRYLCKNGDYKWIEATATNLISDKNINGILLNYHDITERKQAEVEITYQASLLEQIDSAVITIDLENTILSWNKHAEFLYQWTPAEAIGKSIIDLLAPQEMKGTVSKNFDNLNKDGHWEGEFDVLKKDGSTIPAHITNTYLKDEDGNNVGFIGISTDITERKQAEQERITLEAQLRQSQKLEAVGTMVGGVSHEFNNVLQSMFLYGGLVQDELPDNETLRSNFQHILDDGNRARDLIKQILTFSRGTKVELKPQRLHELLMEVLVLERASLPATIEIKQDLDINCGPVLCDKTQIHQIMINLCNNAQHAMEEKGGTLTVRLKQIQASMNNGNTETAALELTVSDTGHGIEASDLERIFDPFFTTKQFGRGTGLGLSVIHGIVEMMDGQISVTSELGKGTTFRILFPVTEAVQEEDVIKSSAAADVMSRSILLVDDEESIRSVTQIILTRKGFKVDSASDGKQALKLFKANPGKYDFIVTDQSMPKMSGVELTQAIRNTKSDIPIMLSTGQLGIEDEKEFKDIGITAHIQKPWTAEELIQRIQELGN